MALFQSSLIIQLTTRPSAGSPERARTAQWSEGWHFSGTAASVISRTRALAELRARLLSYDAGVVGYRIQELEIRPEGLKRGSVSAGKFSYPGTIQLICDVPQVALECYATGANAANSRRFTLRGFPDAFFSGGAFNGLGTSAFRDIQLFFASLPVAGAQWIGRDLAAATTPIASIINSVVTTQGAHGLLANSYVQVLRARDTSGNQLGGRYWATAVTDTTITLGGFPTSPVVLDNGSVRASSAQVINVAGAIPVRACSKKVGNPSDRYRGRQSARRGR